MDIAAVSMGMSHMQLEQNVSLAVTQKVMQESQIQAQGLLEMMHTSTPAPHPTSGQHIDIHI